MFKCLTGQVPFEGDDVVAVLARTLFAPMPRAREQRPDVPVSTPLDVPPGPTAPPDPTQRRVQLLRQLATSGQSAEVREWAQTTLEKLGG